MSRPVASPLPDSAERALAVSTFDRPLLVEAGAGTGKTSTLVGRILAWALSRGWEHAEADAGSPGADDQVAAATMRGIVAITFTEAAAAEMASRVGAALAELAAGKPTPNLGDGLPGLEAGPLRARARSLLVALDQLVVCTIHAYCRRLLAQYPLPAGLHPMFTVDADETQVDEVARDVVRGWLREEGDDADLLVLARRGLGADHLVDAVREVLKAGLPVEALAPDPALSEATARAVSGLGSAVNTLTGLLDGPAAQARRAKKLPLVHATLTELASRLAAAEGAARVREAAGEVFDGGVREHLGKWTRDEFGKEELALLAGSARDVRDAAATVCRTWDALLAWDPELLDAGRRVLMVLVARARSELGRRGALTFNDLLRKTRDLLRDNSDVARRIRREIGQLLVDEFQDTDPVQCDVLRLLAFTGPENERPGLFVVGDPKQSIYGWRGADLAAYDAFTAELEARSDGVTTLSANFRSDAVILEEVDRVIAPAMIESKGVQPPFRSLRATVCRERPAWRGDERWAPVEYWISWRSADRKTRAFEATTLEARALAEDIAALHGQGAGWGSFGVLVRTASDLDVYLEALRQRGIPYQVERDRSYYQRREVIEAAALVRFVVDPCDQLAMVCWLRSASVGVPDAALVPLWRGGLPAMLSDLREVDAALEARIASLAAAVARELPASIPGLARLTGWELTLVAAAAALARLRGSFRSGSAHAFVEELRALTLVEATEAARSAGAFRVANLGRFFRRLAAALEESTSDPGAVLRFLRLAVREQREEASSRPGLSVTDAVTVTTIHGAKGLEFEHVYLMQVHKAAGGRQRETAVTAAAELGLGWEYRILGAATPGWGEVEARRGTVGDAELVRTLYVALTRAKRRLVVAGSWTRPGQSARTETHARLLAGRDPAPPDLGMLWSEARTAGRHWVDTAGARWVFPALAPGDAGPALEEGAAALREAGRPPPAQYLVVARRAAHVRMGRAIVEPASAETHRGAGFETGDDERAATTPGRSREIATAVGSAVHGILEALRFEADLGSELERLRRRAELELGRQLPTELVAGALESLSALIERLRRPPWPEHLAGLRGRVVARELPILASGSSPGQVVVGFADVLARDGSDLVVIDYKTDAVDEGPALAERASAYAPQGATYSRAVQEALGLPTPPRCELWFLRAGRIVMV